MNKKKKTSRKVLKEYLRDIVKTGYLEKHAKIRAMMVIKELIKNL